MLQELERQAGRAQKQTLLRVRAAADKAEEARDYLAYLVEGLKEGKVRAMPELIPLLLRSDGKRD